MDVKLVFYEKDDQYYYGLSYGRYGFICADENK